MTIQPIGDHSAALYLTPADLREHGTTPGELTRDLALALTRQAFAQAGLSVEGPVEIEAYPESCGVLVFARFRPPERAWFPFRDLEDVLEAVRDLGSLRPEGDLVWCEGSYWISVPSENAQAVCRLSEFSSAAEAPFLGVRLSEHGHTLITGRAFATLMDYFPDKLE